MISIIIPVYNKAEYIQRCLKSIISQTYKDYEVILVDDGSDDACSEVISAYLNDNISYYHIDHHNAPFARKYGFKKASGEHILFMDADDEIPADFLKTMYKYIDKADIICCGMDIYDSNTMTRLNNDIHDIRIDNVMAKDLIFNRKGVYQYLANKLIRKDIIDEDMFTYKDMIGEDFVMMMKLLQKDISIYPINETHYIYHQNYDSQSYKANPEKYLNMYHEFSGIYKSLDETEKKIAASYFVMHYMALILSCARYDIRYDIEDEIYDFISDNLKYFLSSSYSPKSKIAALIYRISPELFRKIARKS